jgi:hypothetical protein
MASAAWCVHFTGRRQGVCAQGIAYATVQDEQGKLPCLFILEAATVCLACQPPTPEEAAEMEVAAQALAQHWLDTGLVQVTATEGGNYA